MGRSHTPRGCANRLLHSAAQVETGHPFVHGWISPAANALRFKAVFKADDSSETVATSHETLKQPSGEWLFTR